MNVNVLPEATFPELNSPLSPVIVCVVLSLFVQRTVVPLAIVTVAGLKAKP